MTVLLLVVADLFGVFLALAVLLELVTQASLKGDPGPARRTTMPLRRHLVQVLGTLCALGAFVGPVVSQHVTWSNPWVSPERSLLYALVGAILAWAGRARLRSEPSRNEKPPAPSERVGSLQQTLTNLLPSFDRYESICMNLESIANRASEHGEPSTSPSADTLHDELNAVRSQIAESVVEIERFRDKTSKEGATQ